MAYKLDDVFNIRMIPPIESYYHREDVDGMFERFIAENDKHIAIFGGSKQGKSYLLLKHKRLLENSLTLEAGPHYSSTKEFYSSLLYVMKTKILKKISETQDGNVSAELSTTFGHSLLAKVTGKAKTEAGLESKNEYEMAPINYDDPNVIHSILVDSGNCPKFIILENFHNSTNEFKERFSTDLRSWHDMGIRFIILGVGKEQSEIGLIENNLRDRIVGLNVEPWEDDHLLNVLEIGCAKLNVSFDTKFKEELIKACMGSIGLFQEIVNLTLRKIGITSTIPHQQRHIPYSTHESFLSQACTEKAVAYTDLFRFLKKLTMKSQLDSCYSYYWLVRYLFNPEGNIDIANDSIKVKDLVDFILIELDKVDFAKVKKEIQSEVGDELQHNVIYRKVLSGLGNINLHSREISKENNLYFDEKELFLVNKYLNFYLNYTDPEEALNSILYPWDL